MKKGAKDGSSVLLKGTDLADTFSVVRRTSPFTTVFNRRARDNPASILLMCQLQSIVLPFPWYFGRSSGIERYDSFMLKVLKYQEREKDDALKGSLDKNPF